MEKNNLYGKSTGMSYHAPDEIKVGDKVVAAITAKLNNDGEIEDTYYDGIVAYDVVRDSFVVFCEKTAEVYPLKNFHTIKRR